MKPNESETTNQNAVPVLPPLPAANDPDAMHWAEAFVAHAKAFPAIATDVGAMVGWFANAMMAMHDSQAQKRRSQP